MTECPGEEFPPDPRIQRIIEIFAKETGIDPARLRPDANLVDMGVESLDLTMALFQLEETFDIEIPVVVERAGSEFQRVGDLVAHVIGILDRKPGMATAGDTATPPAPSDL